METGYFLEFHRTHPRTGRGRDKGQRKPKSGTAQPEEH